MGVAIAIGRTVGKDSYNSFIAPFGFRAFEAGVCFPERFCLDGLYFYGLPFLSLFQLSSRGGSQQKTKLKENRSNKTIHIVQKNNTRPRE